MDVLKKGNEGAKDCVTRGLKLNPDLTGGGTIGIASASATRLKIAPREKKVCGSGNANRNARHYKRA
jgi:hypothetical protein